MLVHSLFAGVRSAAIAALVMVMLFAGAARADDARARFPEQYSMTPGGVNAQTGRFIYSKTDLEIGPLKFVRNWGSMPNPRWSPNGSRIMGLNRQYAGASVGWNHSLNQGVRLDGSTDVRRVYVYAGGRTYTFLIGADDSFLPMNHESQGTSLSWQSPYWFFINHEGDVYRFDAIPQGDPNNLYDDVQKGLAGVVYANGARTDFKYNANGNPKFVVSNRGYAVILDYDANQNVSAVCGVNLAITYADENSTCAGSTFKVQYAYDATGKRLTQVTDLRGHVVQISYTPTPISHDIVLPTCISLPNSVTCAVQNAYGPAPDDPLGRTEPDQVHLQTMADGKTWKFLYGPEESPSDVPYIAGKPRHSYIWITDPENKVTGLVYDRGHLIEYAGPDKRTTYHYASKSMAVSPFPGALPIEYSYFDSSPALVSEIEGNREYFEHDGRRNITVRSSWPKGAAMPPPPDPDLGRCCVSANPLPIPTGAATVTFTYLPNYGGTTNFGNRVVMGCGSGAPDEKLCDKPLSRTDARGNVTNYTYDQAHGGVLTETGPADANGVRPQTRYGYIQRAAWVAASGGGYVQLSHPVWLLASKSICKTSAATGNPASPCAAGASDEVRTLYDYGPDSGPNNLELRGVVEDATGQALRSCYGYDARGNRISETTPRAGLASCS